MAIADFIDDARQELLNDNRCLEEDSAYYEACVKVKSRSQVIPPEFRDLSAAVGWSRLYLDSLVNRLNVDGFRTPETQEFDERLMDWWEANNLEQEQSILFLETLIHGRAYISVSAPEPEDIDEVLGLRPDVPIIRIESPKYMWVQINPRTKRVEWAVRFQKRPVSIDGISEDEQLYTVYEPNVTTILRDNNRGGYDTVRVIRHNLGVVPVIPCFNRERASDMNGRSEIIPELRSLQDIATRVLMNMQTAADLMAVPQRLLFGVEKDAISNNVDPAAQYKAYMAGILAFEEESASATQFSAAELSNYTGVMQELSRIASSYTGLPPQYLSFNSQNPSSAEAIRSSEARLVKACELKGAMFGKVLVQVMRLATLVMTGGIPEEYRRLQAILSDPSTPTYAAKADAAVKLTGGKAVIPVERARIDMGYTPEERLEMRRWDEEEADELAAAMLGRPSSKFTLEAQTTAKTANETVTQTETTETSSTTRE